MYNYLVIQGLKLGLAALIGIIVAIVAFFATASVSAIIPLLLITAALALLATTTGLSWLLTNKFPKKSRLYLSIGNAGVVLLLTGLLAAITVLRPFNLPYTPLEPTPQTHDGNLSTGSHIAYEFWKAQQSIQPIPIILLHGGPGVPINGSKLATPLTEAGFNVYSYDQVGGGRSERLEDIRSYTVGRHVADLEAIRQEIVGSQQVILIGGSWGATLAAYYMAQYPEHVAKAILFAPGELWLPGLSERSETYAGIGTDEKQSTKEVVIPLARFLAWQALFHINPQAAYNFAGDREMDSMLNYILKSTSLSGAVCDSNKTLPLLGERQAGWYVNMMTKLSLNTVADPRPKLLLHPISTLILRGECETIPWSATEQYLESLPIVTLLNVKNAGHLITYEQPAFFFAAVKAFLLDQPLPASSY